MADSAQENTGDAAPVIDSLNSGLVCDQYGYLVQPINGNGTAGPAFHTMRGIPTAMAIVGIILIILTSHGILAFRKRSKPAKKSWRFNILGIRWVKGMIKAPFFPLFAQGISILLFALVIAAGLWGSPRTNIGPILTWTWWWVLLIFFVLGFGKVFCMVCPWEGISSLVTSLSLRSRKKRLGFEFKWPRWARNIYPALAFFMVLTWYELGMDITRSPYMTAMMAIVFVWAAVMTALLFEKRAFCRYMCPVGRIQGLYALFSPTELRPIVKDVCRTCVSKACYKGTETQTGCPTNLFPGNLMENTYCTLCTECVRSCPHDNIAINLRPLATDLNHISRFKTDEALLAITLLALTSFHGVTMTPYWGRLNVVLRASWGWGAKPVFTLLMAVMVLLPLILFWSASWSSNRLCPDPETGTLKIFRAFSYSLIPIALFYHVAHNGMHFFMEAQHIIPVLSDPFGWGWNLFGTAGKTYPHLLSLRTIWWIQLALIVIGHVYGVIVADKIAHKLFPKRDQKTRLKSMLPLLIMMIFYSGFSVWLIAQPMEMRTGM
jgi:ferredoxin